MTILQAIILGLVQGFTEFLPISSSAHLYIVPYFFGWDYQGLGFDVALHWGTLVAVLILFWQDYSRYMRAFVISLSSRRNWDNLDQRLSWFLIIATLPAAIFGYLLENLAENTFRNPWLIIVTLAGFGLVLLWADRVSKKTEELEKLNATRSLLVGLAQAVALLPGVSRSGATITAGLFLGLSRTAAAKFSFLLLGPIAFGAGFVTLSDVGGVSTTLAAGFLAAVISGIIAIKILLAYVSKRSYRPFVVYRILLAIVILITLMF